MTPSASQKTRPTKKEKTTEQNSMEETVKALAGVKGNFHVRPGGLGHRYGID